MRGYLVDTNVFLHVIDKCVYETANICCNINKKFHITNTILSELEPGYYLLKEKPKSDEILHNVEGLINSPFNLIEVIDFNKNQEAKSIFKDIRERYYRWIKDPNYIRKLINDGKLNKCDIKYLRKRDVGECELLALAKTSKGELEIITEDKGKVHLHPNINIYDMFKNDNDVIIHEARKWFDEINRINAISKDEIASELKKPEN
ncbi:hypothetical protein ACV3MY_13675 [Clostridium perfringens]